jgi:hypothetical protein
MVVIPTTVIPMVDLPDIDTATSKASHAVKGKVASLFMLDPPMQCKQCGGTTEPSYKYDPQTAAFHAETNGKAPTWYCEACDQHYRRVD